jgi:hypothetical protein
MGKGGRKVGDCPAWCQRVCQQLTLQMYVCFHLHIWLLHIWLLEAGACGEEEGT